MIEGTIFIYLKLDKNPNLLVRFLSDKPKIVNDIIKFLGKYQDFLLISRETMTVLVESRT